VQPWIDSAAARRPDHPALIAGGATLTWAELAERAAAASAALGADGVGEGDHVALALPAGADFVAALHGCLRLGAVAVPVDLRLGEAERTAVTPGVKSFFATPQSSAAKKDLTPWLRDVGEDVVIVWGERIGGAPAGADALRALLNVAAALKLGERDGAGLLAIPAVANGRGLREAGVLPNAGPGFAAPVADGRGAPQIAAALAEGEVRALYLLGADPLVSYPGRGAWSRALDRATTVVAHAGVLTEGIREHADVVFPSEAYAEKNGTVVHPDGRLQRLRQAIAHVGRVHPEWQVIADVARAAGFDLGVHTSAMASQQLFDAVPFYAGITLEDLAGHGLRWPAGDGAAKAPEADLGPFELEAPAAPPAPSNGALRLGAFRSLWAAPEVRISPSLKFLHPESRVEISPEDAQRLGIDDGETVEVAQNGTSVHGRAALRSAVPAGSVFVSDETAIVTGALVEVRPA